MRVGVVGINHKLADLKLREQLAKACQKWFSTLYDVHVGHYFVLLSTCNRTEVYFCSEDLADTHSYLLRILRAEVEQEFDHKLYSYFGTDCFSHLTRVTLGLDSAIIAETEIQGQVKLAYETMTSCRSLPKDLHFLFQKALGIAKKIRTQLQLGRGLPNLEHAILQTGKHLFDNPEHARLLFVGASHINQKIMGFFKLKNFQDITLCNRSGNRSYTLADKLGVKYLPWVELNSWPTFDWVIIGTKSPEYLITSKNISGQTIGDKLIMDLCVPRNVDPALGRQEQITLLNIDQINRVLKIRHRSMAKKIEEAENCVALATHAHASTYLLKARKKDLVLAKMA